MWYFTVFILTFALTSPSFGAEPPVITLTADSTSTYSLLPPSTNTASVRVLSQNVNLQTNLIGKWRRPDNNTEVNSDNIIFPVFTASDAGLYQFYVTSWNGSETLAIQIILTVTGTNFAILTSQGNYMPLVSNIFYTNTTLVCATSDTSQQIQWYYLPTQTPAIIDRTGSSQWNASTGISTLDIMTSSEGDYTCRVLSQTTYIAAIFNLDNTIKLSPGMTGMSYSYVKGVDPKNIILLCDLEDSIVDLATIEWVESSTLQSYNNPLILNELNASNELTLTCKVGVSSITPSVRISIIGPPVLTITKADTITKYDLLPPDTNSVNFRVGTLDVFLRTNFMWTSMVPASTDLGNSNPIRFAALTANFAGLYIFYVTNWEGNQVVAIQIAISVSGSNFGELIDLLSLNNYRLLSGNFIFYISTTLVCATNDTSKLIHWLYRQTQTSTAVNIRPTYIVQPYDASVLSIATSMQGYYSCQVGQDIYDVALFKPDINITAAISGLSYYYIKGIDPLKLIFLCDPNNTAIPLNNIKWILSESNHTYNNPLILNDLNARTGSTSCQVGTSNIVATIMLTIYEPSFTLSYNGIQATTYTTLSPNILTLMIPFFSTQILLSTNIEYGIWVYPNSSTVVLNRITIPISIFASEGRYIFKTNQTWDGRSTQVFTLQITSTGIPFAKVDKQGSYIPISNNIFFNDDTMLVCFTDINTEVMWYYQPTSKSNRTFISSSTDFDNIAISTNIQGFYSCDIMKNGINQTYTAGIFNPMRTTDLSTDISYNYTVDVDSRDIWILCNTNNSNIDVNDVFISVDGNPFGNPLNIYDIIVKFNSGQRTITCWNQRDILQSVNLYIQGPPNITLKFNNFAEQEISGFSIVTVPLFAQNVTLTTNILGNWNVGYETKSDAITIDTFSLSNKGLYYFATEYTWNGVALNASVFDLVTSGIPIAIKTGDVYNTAIVNNQILFESVTLACTSEAYPITWNYLQSSNAGFRTEDESSSTLNGISTLDVNANKQGFYSCNIQENSLTKKYVIGIFDSTTTTVALSGVAYNYTIGVDREDMLLLCDPKSDSINLNDIVWRLGNIITRLPNPLSVYEHREQFETNTEHLICYMEGTDSEILRNKVIIQGPPLITFSSSYTEYTFSHSNLTSIIIPLLTSSIELTINLEHGEWRQGLVVSNATYPTIQIDLFTARHIGVYDYAFQKFDGREGVISVNVIAEGPLIALKNTTGYFGIQNNTIHELNTELACFASNQDTDANSTNWYYQEDISSDPQIQSGEYNDKLGATSINVVKEGIYTCRLQDNMLLSVWIIVLNNTTKILSNEDLDGDDEVTYTIGESLTLIYQNPSISLTSIRWTTDGVKNGDTETILEFYNNIAIRDVFAQLGSGAYTFSCFYRQSPITVVGNLSLNMKDIAYTNLSYEGVLQGKFSDMININFPQPQAITIPILTEDIKLTCGINMCEWLMERNGTADYSISDTEYVIDVLKIENQGLYSLRRKTSANVTYSTAGFMLTVAGFIRQSIISLKYSDINIRPITLLWELEAVLPDEANQIFTITYNVNGISYTNTTTDTTFNLTDLIPGQTYVVYVTLSYAYTLETSNRSVKIAIQRPVQVENLLVIKVVVPVTVFAAILLLVGIILSLVIVILRHRNKRKNSLFKTLSEDNRMPPKISPNESSSDSIQEKYQEPGRIIPKEKRLKVGGVEYANIEDQTHNDIPLETFIKAEPSYTTIDETSLVPLEGEESPNDKQINSPNLDELSVKNKTYVASELKSRSNDEENVNNEQSLGYSRVEDLHVYVSEKHYTPMKTLEKGPLLNQQITTSIPDDQFTTTYKKYIETGVGDESAIGEEFKKLKLSTRQSLQDDIIEGTKPENKIKNPIEYVLPFENNRVVLKSQHLAGNYINASYINNYNFIATMHPTAETLAEFLQMLYQTEASMVVMLASRKEKAKIIGELSDRKAYWPKLGMDLECDPFSVTLVSSTDSNAFIKQELMLTHNVEKKSRNVTHCISAVWNEDNTASNLENVVALLVRIIKQKEAAPAKPIIIHCDDGISKTGVLLTIYNAVQELNQRKTISIYNAVKLLRGQRMQIVSTLACYNTCYALMNEYCSIYL